MWSSLQIYTVEVQGKCSKVTVNCNSDAHGAVTECKKCIGTVNTVNSCIFGIINICSVVCTWMLSVALLSRYLRFGTTRDKWITIFCQGISYFPAASNWILAKKGLSRPIHLYLIFEKSSLKKQVRRIVFLTCINQFRNCFLQATLAVKVQFEID